MRTALALGFGAGLGVLLIVWAFASRPADRRDPASSDAGDRSRRSLRELLHRDLQAKTELVQDATMVGRSLEAHALAKVIGLAAGAVVPVGGALVLSTAGLAISPLILACVGGGGALLGWWLPDSVLRTAAEKERQYFQQVSESWLELAAQLVTAGSDTFAALVTAASYSEQPVFVTLREALRSSVARGEPPWTGLRAMADARRLRFLDPFCAALELSGTTGAESRRAILAQVEAARSRALFEADAAAAAAGEQMGAPLALIGGAFLVLMGYPPLAGIMGGATLGGF